MKINTSVDELKDRAREFKYDSFLAPGLCVWMLLIFWSAVLIYNGQLSYYFDDLRRIKISYIVFLFIMFFILNIIFHGAVAYTRKLSIGKRNVKYIFEGFRRLHKVIRLYLLIAIIKLLWSVLFIIPGIVSAYRYSMAPYILMDNPYKSLYDCLKESKELMRGNKGKLFLLDISFIDRLIFNFVIAFLLIILFFNLFPISYINQEISDYIFDLSFWIIGFLPNSFLIIYFFTARAEFYKELISNEARAVGVKD